MPGEILADDDSPMMMTVGQYNERVAYTWKLAIQAEQDRIVELLEDLDKRNRQPCDHSPKGYEYPCGGCCVHLDPASVIQLIRGEE